MSPFDLLAAFSVWISTLTENFMRFLRPRFFFRRLKNDGFILLDYHPRGLMMWDNQKPRERRAGGQD